MPLVKVTGTNFVRDTNSMALLNTDDNAKNEYYAKVRLLKTQKEEINKINKDINDLKDDMSDIKNLLKKLLDKEVNG